MLLPPSRACTPLVLCASLPTPLLAILYLQLLSAHALGGPWRVFAHSSTALSSRASLVSPSPTVYVPRLPHACVEVLFSRRRHIHLHSLAYHLHSLISSGDNSDISADTASFQTFHHAC